MARLRASLEGKTAAKKGADPGKAAGVEREKGRAAEAARA